MPDSPKPRNFDQFRVSVAAVVLALLPSAVAAAGPLSIEPPIHLQTPSHVETKGGSSLDLPPGYFLPERTYSALDMELRRLQEAETRLGAENRSLRSSPSLGLSWSSVVLVAGAVAVGAVGALYLEHR